MFSETYSTSSNKICRICLKSCEIPLYIFGQIHINNKYLNLKECLQETCDISVSVEDNLPESICSKCIKLLEQSYSFRMLARKNDEFLHKILEGDYIEDNKDYDNTIVTESTETSKCMTSEYISESINSNDDSCFKMSEGEYIVMKEEESYGDESIPDNISDLREEIDPSDEVYQNEDYVLKNEFFVEEDCFEYNECETKVDSLEDAQETQSEEVQDFLNSEETAQQPKEKNFECKFCRQKFVYLKNKRQHEQRHIKEGNRECQVCERKFYTNYDLRRHLYTHMNEKTFKCAVCEKMYLTQPELNRHQKSHESVKKHKCLQCGKDFHELGVLNFHTRTVHLSEKRHECKTCGKFFVTPSKVRRHQKSKVCTQTKTVKTLHVEDEFIILEDWGDP